jgi:hypothetical protein
MFTEILRRVKRVVYTRPKNLRETVSPTFRRPRQAYSVGKDTVRRPSLGIFEPLVTMMHVTNNAFVIR